MTKELPPYTGDDAQCPKCSNVGAFTEWQDAYRMGAAELDSERLRRRCERCDFEWDEALNPPTPA